ncbi:MAG: [NiFe]-hydrogenase assembly chaperone HybE [Thiohalomonadaceae bacterium]
MTIQGVCLIEGLENAFRAIEAERMAGLPILNPALRVEAVGFRVWRAHCVGVLVTPWFMNLMVLPPEGDGFHDVAPGTRVSFELPSGPCDMTVGEEPSIGRFLSVSLFSPMAAFATQEQAVARAEAVMARLMTPRAAEAREPVPEPQPLRRALLRGLFPAGSTE